MANHFDVLIIGAGISGLMAARRLLSYGISNFAILEARDRIGGRIHCVAGENGAVLDLGAHFILGSEDNKVFTFASELGLIMGPSEFRDGNCYISARDAQLIDDDLATQFEEKFDDIFEQCQNDKAFSEKGMTLTDIFDAVKVRLFADPSFEDLPFIYKEDLFAEFTKVVTADLAATNPKLISAVGAAACQGPANMIRGGYSSLLPLFGDETIQHFTKLNTIVTKIVWSETGCLVYAQISNLTKYIFQFKTRWWPDNVGNLFLIWPSLDVPGDDCEVAIMKCLEPSLYKNEVEMTWFRHVYAFDVEPAVGSGNFLVSYASGNWAALIERLPDKEIMCVFCAIICRFFQPNFQNVQMPVKMVRSKWLSDPFARGSYTVMTTGSQPEMLNVLAEPLPSRENVRLMFAGEATHPNSFSTVHGAWETGEREADRIVEALESKASFMTEPPGAATLTPSESTNDIIDSY